MTLKEIIEEKNSRLNTVPDKFLSKVEKAQKKIFIEALSLISSLEQKDGFFVGDAKNINRVAILIEDLREVLRDSEYPSLVRAFIEEFGAQAHLSDAYLKKTFPDFKTSSFADAILKKAQEGATQLLLGSPVDVNFLRPLETLLTDSVATGSPWKETVINIRDFIEGNEDADGRLLAYSKKLAHDKFAIADRSYQNAINNEIGATWYLYSGSVIGGSRCFCIERHEKYFHQLEIESWGAGKDLGDCKHKDGLWQGAFEDTNEKNIFIYAGGHFCRHNFLPVSVFSVPKNVLDRNLENGNFIPTDLEREAIGV